MRVILDIFQNMKLAYYNYRIFNIEISFFKVGKSLIRIFHNMVGSIACISMNNDISQSNNMFCTANGNRWIQFYELSNGFTDYH
jgi:hypothetical protein